jgi:hypothetical protein
MLFLICFRLFFTLSPSLDVQRRTRASASLPFQRHRLLKNVSPGAFAKRSHNDRKGGMNPRLALPN